MSSKAHSSFDPTRLDSLPLTRLHLLVVGLSSLGFVFDLFEVGLGSALSAIFSAPGKATPRELSTLLASVYLGAIIGSPVFGTFADRFGRRTALTLLMGLIAIASAFCAGSRSVFELTLWRVVTGIGIGAYPPLMIAFLTDVLPARRRGSMIFLASGIAALGLPLGVFMVRWLTPLQPLGLDAWRWAFIVGTIGSAVVTVLFQFLPESPRWLSAVGRAEDAAISAARFTRSAPLPFQAVPDVVEVGDRSPPEPPPSPATAILLGLLYFLSPWSTVAFPLLTGAILVGKGFNLSDTLLYVGLGTFGPVVGTLLGAFVVDRLNRRHALLIWAGLMATGCLVFVSSSTAPWLVAASFVFMFGACLYLPTLTTYGSEFFATRSRASGSASVWALNRIGAAVAPLALIPLLKTTGAIGIGAVIAGSLLAGAMVLLALPRGRARQAVL